MSHHAITTLPLPIDALERELDDPECGACVSFIGKVRNHQDGRAVLRLDYEAYPEMATTLFEIIAEEAIQKFKVHHVRIVHRVGALAIGDVAVWVGVAAAHRGEAFSACRYTIDEVKHRAPIWKKEYYADGHAEWVTCQHDDEDAPL